MKMMRIAVLTGALLVVAGCTPLPGRPGYPIRSTPAPAVLGGYGMGYGPFDEPGDRRDYEQFTVLQKKVFENALDARRQVSAVLTQQQRDQLRRDWHDQR